MKTLSKLFFAFFFAIAFGLLIPGAISKQLDLFTVAGIRRHLKIEPLRKLRTFEAKQKTLAADLSATRVKLSDAIAIGDSGKIAALTSAAKSQESEIEKLSPPIVLKPFFPGLLALVWPALYFSLSFHIMLFWKRARSPSRRWKAFSVVTAGLWGAYRWPTWIRNFGLGNENRVVYADANWDVSHFGFVMQESLGLIAVLLMAVLWVQWLPTNPQRPLRRHKNPARYASHPRVMRHLADRLLQWQVSSALLIAGFASYTIFFYDFIFRLHDHRFIPHALIVHGLWLTAWVITSVPLWRAYQTWSDAKLHAIASVPSLALSIEERNLRLGVISSLSPVGRINLFASGIIGVGSFFLPLIQHLFR